MIETIHLSTFKIPGRRVPVKVHYKFELFKLFSTLLMIYSETPLPLALA